MGRVLLLGLVLRHRRPTVWGEGVVSIVAGVLNHACGRSWKLNGMSVRLGVLILLLVGRCVARVALALAPRGYMAGGVVIVHIVVRSDLGVIARQPGVDAWDLPEPTALAGRR